MTGNGHLIHAEAAQAAVRLKHALHRGYGVDPQAVHVTVVTEQSGEVVLHVGVDASAHIQPPPDLPEFEDFRCKIVPFDGVIGAEPIRLRKGPRYG